METYKKGLAERALVENLTLYLDPKKDLKESNLHIALVQIALQLDAIQDEQIRTRKLLERVAGATIR